MLLSEFLEQIRAHYVDALATAIKENVTDPGAWLVEAPFATSEPSEDEEAEENVQLPMRHDLVPMEEGEPGTVLVVRSETIPSFETMTIEGEMPLVLSSFTWDDCILLVQGLPEEADWRPVFDWFETWFDAEGEKTPDERGLLNVIHAFYPPQVSEDGSVVILDVDLGSGPVAALIELLDALQTMGAQGVAIGSSEQFEEESEEEDET